MSDINGRGYGSEHDWENKGTAQASDRFARSTLFICKKCGESFRHPYHVIPDIFECMKQSNIKENCK